MSAPAPKKTTAGSPGPAPPAAEPLRGEIQAHTVPALFHDLAARRSTGTLTIAGRTTRKTVDFRDGRVQFATSNHRDDRFSQILLRSGVVPVKHVLRALEMALSSRDRLGEVMLRLKLMTPADIDTWVKVQVREILVSLFDRTTGSWTFAPGPVAVESISLDLPGDVLVIEGLRRIASWARIYEEVGGLNAEYLATARAGAIVATLPLVPGEKRLVDMCRTPTALGEMCEGSDMGDLHVCRSVWGLLIVGALMKS
jgi:uncharacterized protein DUF4388